MKTFTLLAIIAPVTLLAGPRNSVHYAIPAEACDAGGGASTSAGYANVGNIGGFGGISSVAAKTAKHGYIGQLYEVKTVTIAANPPSVDEGAATQLSATATLDDGSLLKPAASQVQWSVDSGPISGISPTGVATAAVVYQNEIATVRGRFQASGLLDLAVINSNPDNYGLYAGDGLDDGWQVQHFGVGNPLAGPANDPDADGQSNYFEYYATTDPMDALSLFRLRIANVEGRPTHKDIIFSPVSPKREYRVEYKMDLSIPGFAPLTDPPVSDNADERTVRDENATDPTRFYRVAIGIP